MQSNLNQTLEIVGKEKGLDKDVLIEALEAALLTAAKKKFGMDRDLEVHFNEDIGEIEIFEFKTVVEKVADTMLEISDSEALQLDPEAQIGDSLGMKLDTTELGRIAAQTAKQVLIQKVRETVIPTSACHRYRTQMKPFFCSVRITCQRTDCK